MREKLPSSVLLAILLSGILTVLFLLLHGLGEGAGSLWGAAILFFLAGALLIGLTLELGLFRRLKNQRSQNQREIKKLKEMEAYRREFLGEVSHELKTPHLCGAGLHSYPDRWGNGR